MQAVHILCPAGRRGSVHIQREEMHEELGSYPVPSRTAWKPQYHGGHSARSSWFISCAQQDGVEAGIRCLQWSARSEVHILCPAGRRGSALTKASARKLYNVHILCPAGRRGSVEMTHSTGEPLPGFISCAQQDGVEAAPFRWRKSSERIISCAQQDGVEATITTVPPSAPRLCILCKQDGVEVRSTLHCVGAGRGVVHILCPAGRRGRPGGV